MSDLGERPSVRVDLPDDLVDALGLEAGYSFVAGEVGHLHEVPSPLEPERRYVGEEASILEAGYCSVSPIAVRHLNAHGETVVTERPRHEKRRKVHPRGSDQPTG